VNRIPGTRRLFFALQPRPEQSASLVNAVAPLLARLGAQGVPAENLHATLCFIGAVAPGQLEGLKAAAASVRGRPIRLCFDRLEHWHPPRVLCATAAENPAGEPARSLAEALAAASLAAGLTPDVKPFRAHLTLARKVDATRAAQCEWPQPLMSPLLLECDRFALMESRKMESGSIYSVVDSWPLYADDTGSWPANIQ
jgi:2'-5' RNA ligase